MFLHDYAKLLKNLIPVDAKWISIDEEAIRIFKTSPTPTGVNEKHIRWHGHNSCVAVIRYWKGFLDLSDLIDLDGKLDWYLGSEKAIFYGWKESETLENWIKFLDKVLPMEFTYATLSNGIMKLWNQKPVYLNGNWINGGGRKPLAVFSAPPHLVKTAKGLSDGSDAIVRFS